MVMTKNEIFNLTLTNIGHTRRVNDPAEETNEARNCRSVYDVYRRMLLSMGKWGFAKTLQTLTPTGETPASGWQYEYLYPQRCLKALEIARSSSSEKPIPYQRGSRFDPVSETEKQVIWTNQPQAQLLYIRDVENTASFTAGFDLTLSYLMSFTVGGIMALDRNKQNDMFKMFQWAYSEAVRSGEVEAEDEPFPDPDWIKAYGG